MKLIKETTHHNSVKLDTSSLVAGYNPLPSLTKNTKIDGVVITRKAIQTNKLFDFKYKLSKLLGLLIYYKGERIDE